MDAERDWAVEIVTLESLRLAGLRIEVQTPPGGIPNLWDQFIPRWSELAEQRLGDAAYGVSRSLPGVPENQGFEYLAAVRVRSCDGLPAGMVGWELEGGVSARIVAHGLPDLMPAIKYFYHRWAPEAPYASRSNYCLEVYPASFAQDELIQLYFPVQPRKPEARGTRG